MIIIPAISGSGGIKEKSPTIPNKKDIYFKLRGQSNAAGRALSSWLETGELEASYYDRIFIWRYDLAAWRPYYPNGAGAATAAGMFGIENFLAVKLRDYYNDGRKILIDKYGVSDTALGNDGSKEDWNLATNELWLLGKNQYTSAMANAPAYFFDPDYKLFVWWQGERDASDGTWKAAYQQNYRDIFDDEKTFVSNPNLHYVDMGLSAIDMTNYDVINTAKTNNAAYYSNSHYIQTHDLDVDVHANTDQMRIIAQRIFDEIKDLWQ